MVNLKDVKDIRNYNTPNFIGKNRKLYLMRCYECDAHGRENWAPAVASGTCAWCGWKADQAVVDQIVQSIIDMALNSEHPQPGMTLSEIKERYPEIFEDVMKKANTKSL